MKNFKHYLFAVAALVVGFAFSACQPDTPEEKPAQASVQINVASVTASGAVIEITTQGVSSYAYIMNELELPATAIYGGGTVVEIEDASVSTTTEVSFSGLEATTDYTVFFAVKDTKNVLSETVYTAEFTTIGYSDVLTVVDRMYDGFSVHIAVPEDVKARGNGLRYSTSSLPMYNYMKSLGSMELDMLLYNAQQYTTKDKTVIYDEYHSTERDENGDLIYDEAGNLTSASYADPKVPGEPGVFIVGEFSYMDNPNENIVYENGEITTVYEDMYTGSGSVVWAFPAGWSNGYYRPEFDWISWINDIDTDAYDTEKYWTGYYQRIQVDTLEPEVLDGKVDVRVSNLTPVNAIIDFTPDSNVVFYNIMILEESDYQAAVLPLLEYNEEYLCWFTGSYFGLYTFGSEMATSAATLRLTDWFGDTKGYAGKEFRVLVAAMGDNQGRSQSLTSMTFTLPEVTKAAPEVVVTAVEDDDPYLATFNIKAPNKDAYEAYFACNYVREFDDVLGSYTYLTLLQDMGNKFGNTEIEMMNSDEGFTFSVASRENATTRLAVLVYNDEGTHNNVNATGSTAVCEYTTPRANYPARVNSDLFEALCGEWTASAPMIEYTTDAETGEGKWIDVKNPYTSDVTISGGVYCPEELPEEVYQVYAKAGVSREETDELFEEYQALAKEYNNRTRGFNRLLCLGYNFADEVYGLDTRMQPWDLFIAEDYGFKVVSNIFYDFGPKWNLEIDKDGNVWLPIDIEKEFPMETFKFGMDYSLYMLAVGMNSYLGAPYYKNGELILDSRFPVEVSEDRNTITIKPIVYNYTNSAGQPATEIYYPCVAQLQYGQAQPLNPRVAGDVVLTRKAAAAASKSNVSVGGGKTTSVKAYGAAPAPMARATKSMTSMDASKIAVREQIVREQKMETGMDSFHQRAKAMVKGLYGIEL